MIKFELSQEEQEYLLLMDKKRNRDRLITAVGAVSPEDPSVSQFL